MILDAEIQHAVSEIYAAAVEPSRWLHVLRTMGRLLKSPCDFGTLVVANGGALLHCDSFFDDPTHAFWRAYAERFRALDPLPARAASLPVGRAVLGDALMRPGEYFRTPYWNECVSYFAPGHRVSYGVGAVVERGSGGTFACIGFGQSERALQGPAEVHALGRLLPHVHRAVALNRRAGFPLGANAAGDIVDSLTSAICLLGEGGRVLRLNAAAERLLSVERALRVRAARLTAADPAIAARLEGLIREVTATGAGRGLGAGGGLSVPRGDGRASLAVWTTPLARSISFGEAGAVAAVFVTDPGARAEPHFVTVARLFGLTPAEARLAWLLSGGASVESITARLGIRPATARNHIRSALQKTGCRRQAELVRLLIRATPPMLAS